MAKANPTINPSTSLLQTLARANQLENKFKEIRNRNWIWTENATWKQIPVNLRYDKTNEGKALFRKYHISDSGRSRSIVLEF